MPLTLILTNPCSTSDNLLKLSHRLNFFIDYYETASFAIHSSRKHLRCSYNCRIWLINIYKVIQLLFPLIIISSYLHNVAMIFLTKI